MTACSVLTFFDHVQSYMPMELITKQDLQDFRLQLLNDIRKLIPSKENHLNKPWLKNAEVRKLLSISSNTIQRLRISGRLRSSKIGGIHYYKYEDIEKLMENEIKGNGDGKD